MVYVLLVKEIRFVSPIKQYTFEHEQIRGGRWEVDANELHNIESKAQY